MADTIRKVKVVDDVIATESEVQFGVIQGAQNVTSQQFKAISATPNSAVFNLVVPSLETILDRHIMISAQLTLKIDCRNVNTATGATTDVLPEGWSLINYGLTDSLANFPLNRLISTIQCSVNNNTISLQQSDVFDALLRLYDPETLAKYDSKTPTTCDYLSDYADGVEALTYVLDWNGDNSGAGTKVQVFGVGRETGAAADNYRTREQAFLSFNNNILGMDTMRPAGSSHHHRPRGIFKIDEIYSIDGAGAKVVPVISDGAAAMLPVYVKFTVQEPLFLSPFLVGADSEGHHPGIYGINNLNLTINFSSLGGNRAWRAARFPINVGTAATPIYTGKSATLVDIKDATIECKFYTPKGSMLQNPRCVVNYHEIGIYRTSNFETIEPPTTDKSAYGYMTVNGFPQFKFKQLQSANIQLSSIPEKLIIFARRVQSNLYCTDADTYLTIKDIRVNWNNASGLLSTFTQEQLYDASVSSGLKNLTWEEFSGSTIAAACDKAKNSRAAYNGWQRNAYSGVGSTAGYAYPFKQVPTTGSILVLDMARVIQLSQEFDSVGSIGQFSLSVIANCGNQHKDTWNANDYELVILVVNPGVLITQQGSSSSYIGLLTKADVLETSEQPEYITHSHMNKLTGGSFLGSLKNAMHWVHSKITPVKEFLARHVDHPIANKAVEIATNLGYGYTAAGKHKLHDRLM